MWLREWLLVDQIRPAKVAIRHIATLLLQN